MKPDWPYFSSLPQWVFHPVPAAKHFSGYGSALSVFRNPITDGAIELKRVFSFPLVTLNGIYSEYHHIGYAMTFPRGMKFVTVGGNMVSASVSKDIQPPEKVNQIFNDNRISLITDYEQAVLCVMQKPYFVDVKKT